MFRDGRPRCPACTDEHALVPHAHHARRVACEHCHGELVPTAEVEDMISQLEVEPFTMPAGAPGERTCPCCTAKLARVELFGIAVDRCAEHGVWFDSRELTFVLESASGVDPRLIAQAPAGERGLFARLLSLFGSRHAHPWMPRRPPDDR
jgi:hypothetical protein